MNSLLSTRFSNSQEIEQLIKTGNLFRISWGKLTSQPSPHFTLTISISKKQIPLAARRNYQRRRLRNAVYKISQNSSLPLVNLLIFPYASIQEKTFDQLLADLQNWTKFISKK